MHVQDMKNKSVGIHDFAMNPRADIPRSAFGVRQGYKTTFSASYLVPCYCEEVYPGDVFNISCNVVARTAIPIVPIIDNWHMEFFAFFTPNRILWTNWEKFLGAQANPGDSTTFTIPQIQSEVGGFAACTIYDYLGLPTSGRYSREIRSSSTHSRSAPTTASSTTGSEMKTCRTRSRSTPATAPTPILTILYAGEENGLTTSQWLYHGHKKEPLSHYLSALRRLSMSSHRSQRATPCASTCKAQPPRAR